MLVDRRGWATEIVLDADTGFFLPVPGAKALSETGLSELSFSVQTRHDFRSYSRRFLESSASRTLYQTIVTALIESKKPPQRLSLSCVRPRVVET